MPQSIKVEVTIPDKEHLEELLADAVVRIIEGRINKLPENQRAVAHKEILKMLEEKIETP